MKKVTTVLLSLSLTATVWAQESQTAYNYLRLPVSAHAAALGGDNITIIEDDEAFIFHNPALLSTVSDRTLLVNYMNYMSGANTASAAFNKVYKEKATFAISGQYVDYGKMKQVDINNVQTGEFNARDMSLAGYFSYMLGQRWAGGIAAKWLYSTIGSYHSMAVGVDLGLNYYDADREWSVSIVAKNLGGQIEAYDEEYDRLPIDVQIGTSKRLLHTPFRVSATLVDLNHWNYSFINHAVLGVDLLLTDNIWIGGGYNLRRAKEMKIQGTSEEEGSSHGAGLSFGAGLNLERFKLNLAYGKYHVSNSSIVINAAFTL